MWRDAPSNTDDTIDSRAVIDRIEELEGEILNWRATLVYNDDDTPSEISEFATWDEAQTFLTDLLADLEGADAATLIDKIESADEGDKVAVHSGKLHADIEPYVGEDDADEREELAALKAFAADASDYAEDWGHGTTLIRDSYFVEYVQELVSDIGDMPREIPHYIAIDWEKTADNIRVDYTPAEFDGVTYLVR